MAEADGAAEGVRLRAEVHRAGTEGLRPGRELAVDLHADRQPGLRAAHANASGKRSLSPAAASTAFATRRATSSRSAGAWTWNPTGSPAPSRPQGTETAGMPARGAATAKTSQRYIATGSEAFAPMGKAVVGEVGPTTASTSRNAFSKSIA